MQISRGEDAVGQTHHTVSDEMTPAREPVVHNDVAIYAERVLATVECRSTCECQPTREFHRGEELGQQPRVEVGEAQIRVAIREGVGHCCLDLTGDL